MKPKTVAARAAELGTDKKELVRALKALCRWRTLPGAPLKAKTAWGYTRYGPRRTVMSLEAAARLLGVETEDAEREIKASYPIPWTQERVLTAIFEFVKKEGRWPRSRDMRSWNGLPSERVYSGIAWGRQRSDTQVSPRDWWERQVARDRRCTPEMALTLRNVLARKEAIERIGFDTYIRSGLAELVDDDPEFGTLYRLPGETPSEPMMLVKVVNSTAEPDGTFSDYYLRVPPAMTTAREAVWWTFNGNDALVEMPYAPLVET